MHEPRGWGRRRMHGALLRACDWSSRWSTLPFSTSTSTAAISVPRRDSTLSSATRWLETRSREE
eukprot:2705203-Prymnesium_polylepis.1